MNNRFAIGYKIRFMEAADLPRVAELEIALFPDNCMNEKTMERELTEGFGLVAMADEIVGYALCRVAGSLVDILRLGVIEGFQQRGVGTSLLETAITKYKTSMLSVRKTNQPAIKLYASLGFLVVGDLGTSWVMRYIARA